MATTWPGPGLAGPGPPKMSIPLAVPTTAGAAGTLLLQPTAVDIAASSAATGPNACLMLVAHLDSAGQPPRRSDLPGLITLRLSRTRGGPSSVPSEQPRRSRALGAVAASRAAASVFAGEG